jgi:hypothetical protein
MAEVMVNAIDRIQFISQRNTGESVVVRSPMSKNVSSSEDPSSFEYTTSPLPSVESRAFNRDVKSFMCATVCATVCAIFLSSCV